MKFLLGALRELLPGVVCGSTDCVTNQIELRCSGVRSGVNCVPGCSGVHSRIPGIGSRHLGVGSQLGTMF